MAWAPRVQSAMTLIGVLLLGCDGPAPSEIDGAAQPEGGDLRCMDCDRSSDMKMGAEAEDLRGHMIDLGTTAFDLRGEAPPDLGRPPAMGVPITVEISPIAIPETTGPACNHQGWCWENPLPQGNDLNALWGTSADDVWAAGKHATVMHLRGGTWRSLRVPESPDVLDVHGTGPKDIWILAEPNYRTGSWPSDVLYHHDGTRWTRTSLAGMNGQSSIRAFSPSDVWVLGWSFLHFDGMNWSEFARPAGWRGSDGKPWAPAANRIWMPGNEGQILYWDGANWISSPTGEFWDLHGIWGSAANDMWAVGKGGTILHYDGMKWSRVSSPTTMALYAIWGSAANQIFAAGKDGTLLRYDGTKWSVISFGRNRDIHALWGTASAWFAVGAAGLMAQRSGSTWQILNRGVEDVGGDIWGTGPDLLFATGAAGQMLRRTPAGWISMPSGTTHTLSAIWGTSGSDIWAVGGATVHYDGAKWTEVPSGSDSYLSDVWGSAPNDYWACGGRTVMRWNGTAWSKIPVMPLVPPGSTSFSLRTVWGRGPNDVYFGGSGYTLAHWGGGTGVTYRTTVGSRYHIVQFWGSGASIWSTGYYRRIFGVEHRVWNLINNGTSWFEAPGFYTNEFTPSDIYGTGPSDVWIVGNGHNGPYVSSPPTHSVFHYDGTRFSVQDVGADLAMFGVFTHQPNNVWIVGHNNAILHHAP